MPRFNMIKQMSESKAVIGLNMLSLWKDRGTLEPWIEPLQRAARRRHDQAGRSPATFSFEDAGAAQTMITERRNVGKVVLASRRRSRARVRCYPAAQMSFQLSLLSLLLLPPRGE